MCVISIQLKLKNEFPVLQMCVCGGKEIVYFVHCSVHVCRHLIVYFKLKCLLSQSNISHLNFLYYNRVV